MADKPGVYKLNIYQGATLDRTFTWKDSTGTAIDLTNYTAAAQVREKVDGKKLLDMTSAGGRIVLGGAAGTIQLLVVPADTRALKPVTAGVWDLELTDAAGKVTRLLEGGAVIHAEVTR
jgi:hypothetical protein